MTTESGPGCSVKWTAVSRAIRVYERTRHGGLLRQSWRCSGNPRQLAALRMWKPRASSLRAMATVAMFLPRRWAISA